MDMAALNSFANKVTTSATAAVSRPGEVAGTTGTAAVADTRKNDSMNEPDREQLLAAVADMQDYIQAAGRNLQFQLDDDSGRMVVTVTEASSGDVIRQMPSEEALRLADSLSEMRSVLFSGEA